METFGLQQFRELKSDIWDHTSNMKRFIVPSTTLSLMYVKVHQQDDIIPRTSRKERMPFRLPYGQLLGKSFKPFQTYENLLYVVVIREGSVFDRAFLFLGIV